MVTAFSASLDLWTFER